MSSVDERVALTVLGYNVHGSIAPDGVPDEPIGAVVVVDAGTIVLGALVVLGPGFVGTGGFGLRGAGGLAGRVVFAGLA